VLSSTGAGVGVVDDADDVAGVYVYDDTVVVWPLFSAR